MEDKDRQELTISTKSFYSYKTTPAKVSDNISWNNENFVGLQKPSDKEYDEELNNVSRRSTKLKSKSKARFSFSGVKIANNKNIRHKIRPEQFRHSFNGISSGAGSVKLEHIAKTTSNEKLRDILITQHIFKERMNAVYEMCRSSGNPIDRARPLKCLTNDTSSYEINNNNSNIKATKNYLTYENDNTSLEINHSQVNQCDTDNANIKLESEFSEDDTSTFSLDFTINNEASCDSLNDIIKEDKNIGEQQYMPSSSNKSNRKFFKSDRKQNTPKMVTITNKIRADLSGNGQFSLNFNEDKFSRQMRLRKEQQKLQQSKDTFFQEQVLVDEIIKNLNDTAFGDTTLCIQNDENQKNIKEEENSDDLSNNNLNSDRVDPYYKYRQRIPFKTFNDKLRKRQELMLDFLIENNICNERNFTIFIAEPDKYRAEAQLIVEKLMKEYQDSTDDEQNLTVCNENSKLNSNRMHSDKSLSSGAEMACQTSVKETLANNSNICERKLFSIFDKNSDITETVTTPNTDKSKSVNKCKPFEMFLYRPKRNIFGKNNFETSSKDNCSRTISRRLFGVGYDQYQIDAGQKSYGVTECPYCGLMYTVHEPEEEHLHSEYHSSVKLLRFKGWLEEQIISRQLDWGHDGRILCLCETSNIRQLQRLKDILTQVIDKEMGYIVTSSAMAEFQLPRIFKAFLAVRKMQIVGVCLVEPLQKAHKYVDIKGVDCCTEEKFDALCGISRIWVAPLHRRLGIATKLMQSVCLHTILGRQISFDKIAFSVPTEVGKLFAQKITGINNFLIYQPEGNDRT